MTIVTWNIYEHELDGYLLHDIEVTDGLPYDPIGSRRLVRSFTQVLAPISLHALTAYLPWKLRGSKYTKGKLRAPVFRDLWPQFDWILSVVVAEMLWAETRVGVEQPYEIQSRCRRMGLSDSEDYYITHRHAGFGRSGGWTPDWKSHNQDIRRLTRAPANPDAVVRPWYYRDANTPDA